MVKVCFRFWAVDEEMSVMLTAWEKNRNTYPDPLV